MPTQLNCSTEDIAGLSVLRMHLCSDSGVNPLSSQVVAAIRAQLRGLGNGDSPAAVLFSSEGRCFCAGADVKEFRTFDSAGFRQYMADVLALYAEMIELPAPIISVVHADARGGGAALALCSDFVMAAEPVKFALPEAQRGLAGGGYLMPRLMGKHRAAEMVLLGREVTASQMFDWGLVNVVCPAAELEDHTRQWCAELSSIPASAFSVGKRSLAAGLSIGLREAMAVHVEAQTEAFLRARAAGLV